MSAAYAVAPVAAPRPEPSRAEVEAIVGPLAFFTNTRNSIDFRPIGIVTFRQLRALVALFGTDRIDLFQGTEDEHGSEAGEISIYKPHAICPDDDQAHEHEPKSASQSGVYKIGPVGASA